MLKTMIIKTKYSVTTILNSYILICKIMFQLKYPQNKFLNNSQITLLCKFITQTYTI